MSAFEELGLCPELIRACEALGWTLPTPVQADAVPLILGGGDVMVAAETGSGKTGAFALPVLQIVHEAIVEEERAAAAACAAAASAAAGGASTASAALRPAVRMSLDDRDALLAVGPDGLTCQARGERAWAGCRATFGVSRGRACFEAHVRDDGLVRVGWASAAASRELGTDGHSFGFGGTGMKSHGGAFAPYGRAFGAGAVVACLLDADAGEVSFALDGDLLGLAFSLPAHLRGAALFPAVCLKNAEVGLRFSALARPPPGWPALAEPGACGGAGPTPSASVAPAPRAGGQRRTPRALILEPSRDLAEQTHAQLSALAGHLSHPAVGTVLAVGGVAPGPCARALASGADVVVGTPGRLADLLRTGALDLSRARFLVLDEADALVGGGFGEEVLALFRAMPRDAQLSGATRLQVLLFSATLHAAGVASFAAAVCDRPSWVDHKGADYVPASVHHACYVVDPAGLPGGGGGGGGGGWDQLRPVAPVDGCHACDGPAPAAKDAASAAVKRLKPHALLRLLDALRPEQAMLFCRTNVDCDNLEKFLAAAAAARTGGAARPPRPGAPPADSGPESPLSALVLAGARSMEQRGRALAAFKQGAVRLLICTDVAARGIDVCGLPLVVNMTLPDTPEEYIHRVGRVGRADALGLAVSLVSPAPERVWYCTRRGHQPWLRPTPADVEAHTVWLDEAAALAGVEARLGAALPRLGPGCELPPELAAELGDDGAAAYGRPRRATAEGGAAAAGAAGAAGGGGAAAAAGPAVLRLAPQVAALAELERRSQTAFWELKRKFAAAA